MDITKVGVIGAGAIGAYFLWGMRELPREDILSHCKRREKRTTDSQWNHYQWRKI